MCFVTMNIKCTQYCVLSSQVHHCFHNISIVIAQVVFLIGYHIVLTLFLASYWRTVWTRPGFLLFFCKRKEQKKHFGVAGDIPKRFRLTPDELDSVEGSDDVEVIPRFKAGNVKSIIMIIQIQKRLLEQIVIDKDLPVAMRTIQGAVSVVMFTLCSQHCMKLKTSQHWLVLQRAASC